MDIQKGFWFVFVLLWLSLLLNAQLMEKKAKDKAIIECYKNTDKEHQSKCERM